MHNERLAYFLMSSLPYNMRISIFVCAWGLAGWKVVCNRSVRICHVGNVTTRNLKDHPFERLTVRQGMRFKEKWAELLPKLATIPEADIHWGPVSDKREPTSSGQGRISSTCPTHGVTVDLAGPGDADCILDLNRRQYDATDLLTSPSDYAWRLDNNPAGQGAVSGTSGFEPQSGGIHLYHPPANSGQRPGLERRNRHQLNDPARLPRRPFTHQADPAVRGRPARIRISHFTSVSCPKRSTRQSKRRRPEAVATIPLLIKVLSAANAVGELLSHYVPGRLGSVAGRCAGAMSFRRRSSPRANPGNIQVLEHFDERVDAFWGTVSDKYPAMVRRDRAYLEWRFGALAERDYRILVAETEDGISGYLVLRCATSRGIHVGLIMDLLVAGGEPGEAAAAGLLAEAERYFREQGASLIAALSPKNTGEHAATAESRMPYFASPMLTPQVSIQHGIPRPRRERRQCDCRRRMVHHVCRLGGLLATYEAMCGAPHDPADRISEER